MHKKHNTHDEDDVALWHVVLAARVGHSRVDLGRNVSEAATRSTASSTNSVPTIRTHYTSVSVHKIKEIFKKGKHGHSVFRACKWQVNKKN